jgi:hypothetical protein
MNGFLPSAFIVLSAAALLFAISFVWATLRTLLGGGHESHVNQTAAARTRADLQDEKESVLKSLKDLEFERDVGKLSDDDFRRLEAEFRLKAKRIMKQLDEDLREHRERAEQLLSRELKRDLKSEKTSA